MFEPSNGQCFSCGRNIYQDYNTTKGYDLKTKGQNTSCPHCHRTFLD